MKYLYSEIADKLEESIKKGEYGTHQKLPSENDLSFQYETTRLTIRKAISELEKRQVVVKDRNKGTFALAPETKISSGINGLVGFTEAAERRNLPAETKLLDLEDVKEIPKQVQEQLQVTKNASLWKIERLRLIDNEPMTHEKIYIQKKFVPDLNGENATGSLFKLIETNVAIAYASQELESVILDGEIGKLLHAKEHMPGFLAYTTSYSVNGYPVLYDESYYRSDKYTFHNILYRNH